MAWTVSESEWTYGIMGAAHPSDYAGPDYSRPRVRVIVSEGLRERAAELRKQGKTTRARRLTWLAGQVGHGIPGSKRVVAALDADIRVVKGRLVQ